MTSLIFHTEETQVLVAMDTLATSVNGIPSMYSSKAFVLPHLRMIICGTGLGGFLGRWFITINDLMVINGIENLDYHAPDSLRTMWKEYLSTLSDPYSGTTTVYHFGFSENTNKIKAYVYRSEKNFESEERDQYGLGLKPECTVPTSYEIPKDIPGLMFEQREIQNKKPALERIYIGGEILVYQLMQEGIAIFSMGKFDDYEETQEAIIKNYEKNSKN